MKINSIEKCIYLQVWVFLGMSEFYFHWLEYFSTALIIADNLWELLPQMHPRNGGDWKSTPIAYASFSVLSWINITRIELHHFLAGRWYYKMFHCVGCVFNWFMLLNCFKICKHWTLLKIEFLFNNSCDTTLIVPAVHHI